MSQSPDNISRGVKRRRLTIFFSAAVLGLTAIAHGAERAVDKVATATNAESYSPAARNKSTNVYWGDTHLHTRMSADAYTMHTRLTPDDAYRFARGEVVVADNDMPARLRRPLDFLAVSDHAEYLGIYARLEQGDPQLGAWEIGQRWAGYLRNNENDKLGIEFADAIQSTDPKYQLPDGLRSSIWKDAALTADKYNTPGLFTAFVAYEWTSMVSGDNLHRVVLFRDDAETAGAVLPFTAQHSLDPEDLWHALADYEQETGGQVMAIAHNGNVSNGRMFSPNRESGQPLDEDYARLRSRWEPVYEVTQVKGDGETHPYLSAEDEFADFERWDEGNITLTARKKPEMLQYEYARSALREGLRHEENLGINPFKFGLIGSTDSHTALSTAEEDNFFGKFADDEPSADRTNLKMAHVLQEIWKLNASGLAAVWAENNTREALFDAMKRREVYASTGPRIQVRFFGGWDFATKDLVRPDYAEESYRKGVPMGGDLTRVDSEKSPNFLVIAVKDPDGANLDRVQIIKGWLDAEGKTHEKIHNVALSDGRKVNRRTGKAPAVGNTVDVANATYTNDIGATELATVWTDPDFDADQRAFYYVRVLQIPTPRWTAYDAKYFGVAISEKAPMVVQDRAYTSPIWYTP